MVSTKSQVAEAKYRQKIIHKNRYPKPDLSKLPFDFFKVAITAFMEDLRRNVRLFQNDLPVYIFNTGDQLLTDEWVYSQGQEVPRMVVDVDNMSILPDQLTNPYQRGEFILTDNRQDIGYSAYVRRIPLNYTLPVKLTVSNIIEALKWQEVLLLLLYRNNVFHFQYYKKDNRGVYRFPEDTTQERNVEFGFDDTRRYRTIQFNIEIELQYPAFDWFNSSSLFGMNDVIRYPGIGIYPDPNENGETGDKNPTPEDGSVPTYPWGNPTDDGSDEPLNPDEIKGGNNYTVNVNDRPGKELIPQTGDTIPDMYGNVPDYNFEAEKQRYIDARKLPLYQAHLRNPSATNSQEPVFPMSVHNPEDIF